MLNLLVHTSETDHSIGTSITEKNIPQHGNRQTMKHTKVDITIQVKYHQEMLTSLARNEIMTEDGLAYKLQYLFFKI